MRQIVIVAGIAALLAAAIVGATYNVEPAKACVPNGQPYGKSCVSPEAQAGGFGTAVSSLAQANGGLHDCRAAGMKGCGAQPVGAGGSSSTHGNNG
jgi:hypothetical protein